ncbi:saccharopine dehydrogenase NADP-binding domain-containing protein [Streptomyces sp. ISL-36]|uniref:saccharopine dehydrogenase family protein n=1 Tax=Streptomyces sp. ISL-36 TaxID=2819182 RepID=UPI001BEC4A20|nr:saccharopine dehydrogenase NADP-binding domain-containing protein [Streptomyces sp. ISL-36]MBT2441770.1 saccharopine dehydrogenase NADP-binding domain-containing protein [Streptomyces sp. ISL-36]
MNESTVGTGRTVSQGPARAERTVVVYGAYGHTGRFVVAELLDRGWTPVLSGRDADRLQALAADHGGLDVRPATIDDPASLDRALSGASAVVNCAGPFASTAAPVIEAALRARIPYVDVAAELEAVADTFTRFADRAREAGTVIVPAMAFYGGLSDLLVSAALGRDRSAADEVLVAYALNSWHPTAGTRASSRVSRQRRDGRRLLHTNGRLEFRTGEQPRSRWSFPEPVGERSVVGEFTMAESVTVPRHVRTGEIRTFMTVEAVNDLVSPDTPSPAAVDERGRSAQTFLVEVVVRSDGEERRAVARGRDIYAVTAPLAVEAVIRILDGRIGEGRINGDELIGGDGRITGSAGSASTGVAVSGVTAAGVGSNLVGSAGVGSAGELFDASDFLTSLSDSEGGRAGDFHWALTTPARTARES